MKPVFSILLLAISWATAEPPVPSYYHSSYDDAYAQQESPRQSGSHSSRYSHSPASSYPAMDDPNVEHEVIVQHHHYPAPAQHSRVVQHGGSEYNSPSHSPVTTVKKTRTRSRPHYHQSVRASSYDAPKTAEYSATPDPSMYDAYSSPYKSSDYKTYSVASAPLGATDDYGVEAFSPAHSQDYGTPSTYQNQPSYKVASHSYSPPSPYSPSSSSGSYSAPAGYEPHQGGYRLKTYRGSSSYGTPVKTSYKTSSSAYGVPKTSYGSPKYVTVSSSRPSYSSVPKTVYGTSKPYSKPSYYRATKTYAPTSSYGAVAPSYAAVAPTYASASPSYSYGSPSTKPHGYSYTEFDKPMEKGYLQFAATPEDSYGDGTGSYLGSMSAIESQGEEDPYGGVYSAGSSPY